MNVFVLYIIVMILVGKKKWFVRFYLVQMVNFKYKNN